jgi:SAM-dependent methyltransferase
VTGLIPDDRPVLDMGCGSSRIIGALPPGSVGVDILLRKLRHARRFCSQVIEHVPKDTAILDELCRVLAPGGRLILGTPDYDRWEWVVIEKLYGLAAPGGYADEHIAHYTRRELIDLFARRGFAHEATRYILRGELILAFRKPDRSPPLPANAAAP